MDKFTYLGSYVSSTENDINMLLAKAWIATDKKKRCFFQAVVISMLLYGCTTWTLTKRMEKSLTAIIQECCELYWTSPGGNTLQNSSCKATYQPSRKLSGDCWSGKDELICDILRWTPSHGRGKVGRPARTYLQQFCADTGCRQEDLPGVMVIEIRSVRGSGNPC